MLSASSGECQCLWKHHTDEPLDAAEHKATQTFKCRVLPPANDFGGRCVTMQALNFLQSPGSGAVEGSSFQEQRVDLYGSIFNFPVWAHLGSISWPCLLYDRPIYPIPDIILYDSHHWKKKKSNYNLVIPNGALLNLRHLDFRLLVTA